MENSINGLIILELAKETTKILETKQEELKQIVWQVGESNTDLGYSVLACKCCEEAWNIIKQQNQILNYYSIECTPTDINIHISYQNESVYRKIELKSSISKIMPSGSTIKKLDINQPLIYCLRPSTELEDI
jgi:hypothetical protein